MNCISSGNPIGKYEQLLVQEDIRQSRFNEALNQIQAMELNSVERPYTMQNLLNYKI